MLTRLNPVLPGFLASLGLALFYFLTLGLVTGDWQFPWKQFWHFKYLMTILVLGFGVHVGLWQYLRLKRQGVSGTMVVAGGAISGGSMVACCAHHLSEIIPILGISGLSVFLTSYQRELLFLGVLANLSEIILIIKRIRTAKC